MSVTSDILDEDENVYGVFRQHYVFLVGQVITELILLGLVLVAMSMTGMVLTQYKIESGGWLSSILYGVLTIAAIVLLVSGVIDFLRWYYSAIIVSTRRLIRRTGIFQRAVVDMSLQRISEINMTQSFWGRMVGYADFMVMSESETGQEIRGVMNPIEFRTALDDARVGEARDFVSGANGKPIPPTHQMHPAAMPPSTTQVIAASADEAHRLQMWSMLEALFEQGILTEDELESKRQLLFESKRNPAPAAPERAHFAEWPDDVTPGDDGDGDESYMDTPQTLTDRDTQVRDTQPDVRAMPPVPPRTTNWEDEKDSHGT